MKTKLFSLIITLTTLTVGYSQCTIDHQTTMFPSNVAPMHLGQSFTAECDGNLVSFRIYASEPGTVSSNTLNIYEGNTTTGTPLYTQSYPEIVVENNNDPMVFEITDNVPLTEGNQYTFYVVTDLNIYASEGDTYTGGSTWVNSTNGPDLDISFGVETNDGSLNTTNYYTTSINIYPNPTSDYLIVSNFKTKENYSVFNVQGKEVLNGIISENEKINVKNFAEGLYFLKFDDGNTFQFIKK